MRVTTTVFFPFGQSYTANGVCALCILPESTRICCVAMRLLKYLSDYSSLQNNATTPLEHPLPLQKQIVL